MYSIMRQEVKVVVQGIPTFQAETFCRLGSVNLHNFTLRSVQRSLPPFTKCHAFEEAKTFCLLIFLFLHHIQIALFYICILLGQITTPKTISTILKIVSDSIY